VLGWRLPAGTATLYEAIAAELRGETVLDRVHATPPLSAAKRRAAADNHAGQGVKPWVLARGVPDDLVVLGHGTLLDFAGAMQTWDDGVLLVCFGPSAAELGVTDLAAVERPLRRRPHRAALAIVHGRGDRERPPRGGTSQRGRSVSSASSAEWSLSPPSRQSW
jgi:hypothetical protein